MTGPEHLREDKRLLAEVTQIGEATQAGKALAATAQGHFLAALVCATVTDRLPDRTSWAQAVDE